MDEIKLNKNESNKIKKAEEIKVRMVQKGYPSSLIDVNKLVVMIERIGE